MYTNKKADIFSILNYTFFVIAGIFMLYPFWYVLMGAISDPRVVAFNDYFLLPSGKPSLYTILLVLKQPLIYTAYKNTIFITVVGTAIRLFMTALTAYPLSKDNLRLRNAIFNFMLFTMIFSGGLIPTYLVVRSLGMVDTLWALIVPGAISVYFLMIMIKFFKGIPISLIESAKIDGYNDVSIFMLIILPLSKAVLAAIGLFYAVGLWNTYAEGVIYTNSTEKRVLQVVLQVMLQRENMQEKVQANMAVNSQNMKMAVIVVTLVPILIVYPFLQKHFVKGVMIGSVKG